MSPSSGKLALVDLRALRVMAGMGIVLILVNNHAHSAMNKTQRLRPGINDSVSNTDSSESIHMHSNGNLIKCKPKMKNYLISGHFPFE